MVGTEPMHTKPEAPKKRFSFEIIERVAYTYTVDANTKKEALALLYPEGDDYPDSDFKDTDSAEWIGETKARLEETDTLHRCRFHGMKMIRGDGSFLNRRTCRTTLTGSTLREMMEGDGFVCYQCRSALNDGFTFVLEESE